MVYFHFQLSIYRYPIITNWLTEYIQFFWLVFTAFLSIWLQIRWFNGVLFCFRISEYFIIVPNGLLEWKLTMVKSFFFAFFFFLCPDSLCVYCVIINNKVIIKNSALIHFNHVQLRFSLNPNITHKKLATISS